MKSGVSLSSLFQSAKTSILPAKMNLKSDFQVTDCGAQEADALYKSLCEERDRIFQYLGRNAVVSLANSPSGLSTEVIGLMLGETQKNLIPAHANQQGHEGQKFLDSMAYLERVYQHEEESELARQMFVELMTSSSAPAFISNQDLSLQFSKMETPMQTFGQHQAELEKEYEHVEKLKQRQSITDVLVKAVIKCGAEAVFKLILTRQLALASDKNKLYKYLLEEVVNARHARLLEILLESGMDPNIQINRHGKLHSVLAAVIQDYHQFVTQMNIAKEPGRYESEIVRKKLSDDIAQAEKFMSEYTLRMFDLMRSKNADLDAGENTARNVAISCLAAAARDFKGLSRVVAEPYLVMERMSLSNENKMRLK